MSFYENYLRLCAASGESASGAAAAIGLSNAAATGWKKGKRPSDSTLAKLAEHFGCPVRELTWDRDGFSRNLIRIQTENGKSLGAFAASLGTAPERVRAWLSGAAVPNREELLTLAARYAYDPESLDGTLRDLSRTTGNRGGAKEDLRERIAGMDKAELLELMAAITRRLGEL